MDFWLMKFDCGLVISDVDPFSLNVLEKKKQPKVGVREELKKLVNKKTIQDINSCW